jgi:hypothetical protein
VIKGSKWLLLKTPQALRQSEREHLDRLLKLNSVIATVMILKDRLRRLWRSDSRQQVARAMAEWGALARPVGHEKVERFARRLEYYGYGERTRTRSRATTRTTLVSRGSALLLAVLRAFAPSSEDTPVRAGGGQSLRSRQ